MVLTYISLMTNDDKHIFMYLLPIYKSSSDRWSANVFSFSVAYLVSKYLGFFQMSFSVDL